MTVPTLTPRRLEELRSEGRPVDLLDVRTPVEFREVHVPFARNVPLDRLDPAAVAGERTAPTGEPVYVICKSGSRGQKACEKLLAAGVNVVNVEGGTQAWADGGLPVVRPACPGGRRLSPAARTLPPIGYHGAETSTYPARRGTTSSFAWPSSWRSESARTVSMFAWV